MKNRRTGCEAIHYGILSYSFSIFLSSKYSLSTLFPITTIPCSSLKVEDQDSQQVQGLIIVCHISVFIILRLIKLTYSRNDKQGRYFQEADSY
jgi:hypothetical protein